MISLKVKNIEMYLSDLDTFKKPKVNLEQYATPPRTAAEVLYKIETTYGDIGGKIVGDFGCGPGMLSLGAGLCGAESVIGFEIDDDAIEVANQNIEDTGMEENIEVMKADISQLNLKQKKYFDTIIMNPPFGTRKEGIDMVFLKKALENCSGAVYSMHKTNTTKFIKKECEKWNAACEVVDTIKFPLPKVFKHQKKDLGMAEVDLIRVVSLEKKEQ